MTESSSRPLTDPAPEPRSPTDPITCAVTLNNVIYAFSQNGLIYRVQTQPFLIELIYAGPMGQALRGSPKAIPSKVSRPSRYGGA